MEGQASLIIKHLRNHRSWTLDDPDYDYLPEPTRKCLRNDFPFDFGDILYQEACFMPENMIADALGTTEEALNNYCLKLFGKDWKVVHLILFAAARNEAITNVFEKWAREGSSAAMTIMSNSVMRMNQDSGRKEITVTLVNDLEGD